MLFLKNIAFDYPDRPLLQGITFSLQQGQILHLRGGNGAGKTTLLNIIAGLIPPSHGKIQYKTQGVNQKICYVGHKPAFNPCLTVRENIYFDLNFNESRTNLNEILEILGLIDYLDEPCSQLSAGQKRKLSLLKLWMTQSELWLLDEPFTALDDNTVKKLLEKLKNKAEQGGIIILTSHQGFSLPQMNYLEYQL